MRLRYPVLLSVAVRPMGARLHRFDEDGNAEHPHGKGLLRMRINVKFKPEACKRYGPPAVRRQAPWPGKYDIADGVVGFEVVQAAVHESVVLATPPLVAMPVLAAPAIDAADGEEDVSEGSLGSEFVPDDEAESDD